MKELVYKARMVATVGMVFLPAGCAVGPDYLKPSIELPQRWSGETRKGAAQPPVLARWWRRLNDSLLNDLIEKAVSGNLDVAAAKARVREARASYRQAVGSLFPQI